MMKSSLPGAESQGSPSHTAMGILHLHRCSHGISVELSVADLHVADPAFSKEGDGEGGKCSGVCARPVVPALILAGRKGYFGSAELLHHLS